MSSNNYPYNYGYFPCYSKNSCYNPCQPIQCTPVVYSQPPTNHCPAVSFITNITTGTVVPAGAGAPTGTITPILGYSVTPSTNVGGIIVNAINGQFTVPQSGRYVITAFIGFIETTTSIVGGTRQVYIYKVDGTTNALTLLAEDSRNAVTTGNTYVSIATTADLNSNDRIFVAATQNNTAAISVTTTTDGRFTLTRLC